MNEKPVSTHMDKQEPVEPGWVADLMAESLLGIALCDVESEYSIVDLNHAFESISRMTRDELMGKPFLDIFPEIDEPAHDLLKRADSIGDITQFEVSCSETYRHIDVHAHRISADKLAMVIHDISDRKQVEVELQRNRSLFLTTQRLARIGGWEVDLAGMETFWTDEVYRIHDMEPEDFSSIDEAIQLSLECYRPEDKDAVMQAFERCATDGVPYDQEFPFVTTKGRQTWIRTIASPVIEGDKVVKIVGYLMDIKEQKLMEQEKLLLERQVLHAQKLESLGVLAGGIAHDFNNLLMGVIGNTDLALSKADTADPLRVHLEEIEKAASMAADLAKQMLAYSGKGRFEVAPIALNELVKDTAHLIEASITKKATLIYDLTEGLPSFTGDPTQVTQVIMNLITNASEALGGEDGEIVLSTGTKVCTKRELANANATLLASLEKPLEEGPYVYIDVCDTGCGMDATTVERVFDPFFTTKFTGRGLGMSSVLGILSSHKGAIEVKSKVGEGTRFRVLFPISPSDDSPAQAYAEDVKERGRDAVQGTVLVVDDEDTVRAVAANMVRILGFETLEAPDGGKALELFRQNSEDISCLLLDFKMPHMDGLETLNAIREIVPNVKAIIASGYSDVDVVGSLKAGSVEFIRKPYRLAQLKEKLMSLIYDGE